MFWSAVDQDVDKAADLSTGNGTDVFRMQSGTPLFLFVSYI